MSVAVIDQEVYHWFAKKGISKETVDKFGLFVDDEGAVCFPYGDGLVKKRYGIPFGERSFYWEKGVPPVLFNRQEGNRRLVFICEGETDTMRLRQEIESEDVGVVGLPGVDSWNESMASALADAEQVIVVLDNDEDYRVAARVDKAWISIRRSLGEKARRIYLPKGVKDLCEFFQEYSLDSFRLLVQRVPAPRESRYKVLDLTQPLEPPRWLVEGLFCRGDVHLLVGEPGVGKSMLSMGLAVAVAQGFSSWLGFPIKESGKVLYIDEENPEDLIIQRLIGLGLDDVGKKNIRYLCNNQIRLDKNPIPLIEEALDYQPALIVIDSLSRIHTDEENSASTMGRIFNNGIGPLAREVGAAVLVIHHVNKHANETASGFRKTRGSRAIVAFPDCGFDVTKDGNLMCITNFKARRQAQIISIWVSIESKDSKIILDRVEIF